MQWLNHLDSALERRIKPRSVTNKHRRNTEGGDDCSIASAPPETGEKIAYPVPQGFITLSSNSAGDLHPTPSKHPPPTSDPALTMNTSTTPQQDAQSSKTPPPQARIQQKSMLHANDETSELEQSPSTASNKSPKSSFWRSAAIFTGQVQNEPNNYLSPLQTDAENSINLMDSIADDGSDSTENGAVIELGASSLILEGSDVEIAGEQTPATEDFSDFYYPSPLPVWNDLGNTHFDQSMNCFGVVHVRILRAQRLPCPVGSSVYSVVSLPPWQGRVRTERTLAFMASTEHGVCIRWDQLSDTGLVSMVNAWNSEESPVPSIKVDLMFSPLGMGILEFSMCTLNLDCKVLMQSPGKWQTQWCKSASAELKTESSDDYTVDNRIPLIQVEAMFAPSGADDESSVDGLNNKELSLGDLMEQNQASPRNTSFDESFAAKSVTSATTHAFVNSNKPHLLRLVSFWIPGACSVCSKILVGYSQGFHCEECNIDCCSDCRLNVDLQIPCGSDTARTAVKHSLQNKLSLGNILSVVAPDNVYKQKAIVDDDSNAKDSLDPSSPRRLASDMKEQEAGVGCLKLEFVKACLFERPLPAETDPDSVFDRSKKRTLRQGDYYARISLSAGNKTARTRTLQNTASPKFSAGEMRFNVPHYGMEFRLEVIDASTDLPVGTTLLSTHGILQDQRDMLVAEHGVSLFQFIQGPIRFEGKRTISLALRTGVKSGFSPDFFVAKTAQPTNAEQDEKVQPGGISGWIEVQVGLEENVNRLYSKAPYECPPRPPDDLNMMNFQVHVARIKALIDDFKHGLEQYNYVVSWKNAPLTALTLVIFLTFCLCFNAEYSGSLPFLFLIACVLQLAMNRSKGGVKNRFIRKEIEACKKEGKTLVNYTVHRPFGTIDVAIHRGKNLYSREFGIPGRTGCHVYWDPLRYGDEKSKKAIISVDRSAESKHAIGFTKAHYTADPVWDELQDSIESKRLQQLLPKEGDFFEVSEEEASSSAIHFPILQPFKAKESSLDASGIYLKTALEPWTASKGAIVVEVRFQDILNSLPGFEDVLGEVAIPFSKLVERGEISGWFQVLDVGTTSLVPGYNSNAVKAARDAESDNRDSLYGNSIPQVHLSFKWTPPGETQEPSETDRETSVVIQEEFLRSSILARESKIDLVGSSIGALNTALGIGGNVQVVQNTLGSILDILEGVRNAFNFTDPYKSSVLLVLLVVVWLALALIPTRYIILAAGLAQYTVTFLDRFGYLFNSSTVTTDQSGKLVEPAPPSANPEESKKTSPVVTWIMNAIRGLPTDEDLRKTYFWESRRKGARETENDAAAKRLSRLQRLWKAQWYSSIKLRLQNVRRDSSSADSKASHWENVFAIVQGHRFLWWHSVREFDNGELPSGRIFLSGHAGLATPSPLEMREFTPEELKLVVSIFGRGKTNQERVTLLAPDAEMKERLEDAVLGVADKDD